jgi:hypothetical protein
MSVLAWHFTGDTLRDGSPLPKVGEWLEHTGPVVMCDSGLHASRRAIDALRYAPGPLAHLVECDGVVAEDDDKFVCRRRKILASVDAAAVLRAFARWCALSVIDKWDAPDVVVRYLRTGDDSLRSAAESAGWSAAWSAVWSAESAAWAAWAAGAAARSAESAAESARSAAWSAAGAARRQHSAAAAKAAAWAAQNERLEAMLLVEMGSRHPVLTREISKFTPEGRER